MKILLAIINEPRESIEFLRYVARMAFDLKALVKVLHVQPPTNYQLGNTDSHEMPPLEAQRTIEKIAEDSRYALEKNMKDIIIELSNNAFAGSSSEIGSAALIANQLVSENKVDMVVLEGQKEESFWIQTSTNMDVIHKVDCPVWIIPQKAVYTPFSEIVYATDYKREDIANLKKLIRLFPDMLPNITALHITDSIEFDEEVKKSGFVKRLQAQISYPLLKVRAISQSNHDDLIDLINDYAVIKAASLIVVLKENESFFERIFKPSHTQKILKSMELPVLVFQEKK